MPEVPNDLSSAKLDELVTQFNQALKTIATPIANVFHAAATPLITGTAPNGTLPVALALTREIRVKLIAHLADGLRHKAASALTIAAADPTDLATAITAANEIKADYGTHLSEAGVHFNNDGTHTIAAADATDLTSLDTLLTELKADLNLHWNSHANAKPTNAADVIKVRPI